VLELRGTINIQPHGCLPNRPTRGRGLKRSTLNDEALPQPTPARFVTQMCTHNYKIYQYRL